MRKAQRRIAKIAAIATITGVALFAVGPRPVLAQEDHNCPASASWVTSPSQPDFNVDPQTICAFYQYSWQSFLYLTSPAPAAGGALHFETWRSVADVVAPARALTASNEKLLGLPGLFLDRRQNRMRRFEARGSEPIDGFEQAGSRGVLVDQKGNVTYYEQFLNVVAERFIHACDLNLTFCQQAPAAQSLRFPAGSIELKVSWRPLAAGDPALKTYYTLADVEVYNPKTKQNEVMPFLGLAGFHLVYTTPGHPEMVWATFEHVDNAPSGPCTGPTTPPQGFSGWAFNDAKQAGCGNVNQWNSANPYAVTQAFRNYPDGCDLGTDIGKIHSENITSLNRNMLGVLPANSVWRNYYLVGALWTKGGALPPTPPTQPDSNAAGSVFLANATMETFTQYPNPAAAAKFVNCFTCHTAKDSSGTPVAQPEWKLSHALAGNQGPCAYSTTLPPACAATQPKSQSAAAVEPIPAHAPAAASNR
jgi:hypothetical protein